MFIINKYNKWYFNIIANAQKQNRIYNSLKYEKHHIQPRSLSGSNEDFNIVYLTFREHYICHLLLTRFTVGKAKSKMCFALHTFFHFHFHRPKFKYSSYLYEAHKRMFIKVCKNRIPHNIKKVNYLFSNMDSDDKFYGSIMDFGKYSNLTPQEINWLVTSGIDPNGHIRYIKQWGIYIESLNIFSYDKPKSKPKSCKLIVCEFCNTEVDLRNYKRWHGDKCKSIDTAGHNIRTMHISSINKKS